MAHTTPFKLIAFVLVAVLMVVAGMPAKAEALEPLTIVAIAGLVAAGIVLIAYLVVANVEGDKASSESRLVWMACAGDDDCASIPAETAQALIQPAIESGLEPVGSAADRQGP